MDGPTTGVAVFACLFSSAVAGLIAHARLPAKLLTRRATTAIRRSVWIVAMMAALMLALLTVQLKTHFDSASRDVRNFSSQIVALDRTLRQLGPEADPARSLLFRYSARIMKDVWPQTHPKLGPADTHATKLFGELERAIGDLESPDARMRDLEVAAMAQLHEIARARWNLGDRDATQLSPWLVSFLVLWLMLTFGSLSLSAPRSPLVMGALFLCALALSSEVFLTVEFADPYVGLIIVSSEPVQNALFALSE
ncbi:bestrophin-like domain [Limobrevibacterium gyesilva]|uniref:DUF4239 domain-containing protein n=1 Tax=Limobrevibacterium gyesilva TaxID=2991712 RepID=A0AA42CIS4_9PROT|nr:hypothetical protein [Limobrevibacterium gyesilva]MCW3476222.1 hypothetical protein [Limobrevibacterium gyesilva]